MNEDKERRLIDSLLSFVERVANGKATCEAEVEVLPQVASLLFEIINLHH